MVAGVFLSRLLKVYLLKSLGSCGYDGIMSVIGTGGIT